MGKFMLTAFCLGFANSLVLLYYNSVTNVIYSTAIKP